MDNNIIIFGVTITFLLTSIVYVTLKIETRVKKG